MHLQNNYNETTILAVMAQSDGHKNDNMSPQDFLETFCHLIGDPDSMLRADLMAPVFRTFGENDETFSDAEAADIIERLTGPENLSYLKNAEHGQPVLAFKRSYSALVVACILWRNHQKPFLNAVQLSTINERLKPGFMTHCIA